MTRLRRAGRILRMLVITGAAALGLCTVLAGLAGSETGLTWLAGLASSSSAGRLSLEGVHGSLYGHLSVDRFRYCGADTQVQVDQLRLDWSPRALLQRELRIDTLSAHAVRLELSPSDNTPPPTLPESLRLPLSLALPDMAIGRLTVVQAGNEQVLTDLAATLSKPADTYRARLSGRSARWGRFDADLSLTDTAPFAMSAQARLARADELPYQLDAHVEGPLARLAATASFQADVAQASADATITAFERRPLAEAHVSARDIDPARLDQSWPKAALDLQASLRGLDAGAYAGEVRIDNRAPGAWDRGRLPIRALSARFAGTPDRLALDAIDIDLARAGRFQGQGEKSGDSLVLELATQAFDPSAAYTPLRSMKLAGSLRLEASSARQAFVADLRDRLYGLHLDAAHQGNTVVLNRGELRSAAGQLSLYGQLDLGEERRFEIAGGLAGFDPAAFGAYPRASINASFDATGRLAPAVAAEIGFAVADSRFQDRPLSGKGRLSLAPQGIRDADAELRLANDQLTLQGAFGRPGDRLKVQIDADDLAVIHPELTGKIHASGTLIGSISAPSGEIDVDAAGLRLGQGYRVANLKASGRLAEGLAGEMVLELKARDLGLGDANLERAEISVHGQRQAHAIQLLVQRGDTQLNAALNGGWREPGGWSGQITGLTGRGAMSLALLDPAALDLAPSRVRLGPARFALDEARFDIAELAWQPGRLASQGGFRGLALDSLRRLDARFQDWRTDLTLAGAWQVDAGERLNGHLEIRRERGDVTVPTVPATSLGLARLTLAIDVADDRLDGRLQAAGDALGQFDATGNTLLERRDGAWGVAADAPIKVDAELAVKSLAWAAPLLDADGGILIDGALEGRLDAGGRVGAPVWHGHVAGHGLNLALPDQGVDLREGRFRAELQGDLLRLSELSLQSGDGRLTGQGQLALRPDAPDLSVTLTADKLEVLSRPDRHLVLSGTGEASSHGGELHVAAHLKADRGLIELASVDAPSPSSDVIVLGSEKPGAQASQTLPVRFELDLDLGDRFYFKGKGVDAQLAGAVRLSGNSAAAPRMTGSIRVTKGAYAAYGQNLAIERGILNFQGPLDNPGLNVLAMRRNQTVAAGVSVSGSARSPQVKLVSEPDVPDNEKLSWLVLGHGTDGVTGEEFNALQAAAGALLQAGESVTLQQRIARAAGLEEVSLKGDGSLANTVLTLGKRLSSKAYLSYEHGLGGAATLVKINYDLSQHLSVQAQAGETGALDLFYTFSFD